MSELRQSIRSLAKAPGFTILAVLTLALGLTVNASIFYLASGFFLRPLPAANPDRLVVLAQQARGFGMPYPLSYPDSRDLQREVESSQPTPLSRVLSGLAAYLDAPVHLSRNGLSTDRTWVQVVTPNYFDVLGIRALHGRLFRPGEGEVGGSDRVIVLTHHEWRNRFGGDPNIVGSLVKLNGVAFTVIGVTPERFVGASWGTSFSGFVPTGAFAAMEPGRGYLLHARGDTGFFVMGRLQPGATVEEARSALKIAFSRLVKEYPDYHSPGATAWLKQESRSRPTPFIANYTPLIVAAMSALGLLVMFIAIANVANLLYARAADRERELAIRSALGASRWQLLRQLLLESVLLALSAGVVGALASVWITPYLGNLGPGGSLPPPLNPGSDWRLFAFTFAAALITGVLTAWIPAMKATRVSFVSQLNETSRSTSSTRHPLRSVLVVAQIAFSFVVLICAGLAYRSFQTIKRLPLGFDPKNLLMASFDLGLQRYDETRVKAFQRAVLDDVRALPGVRSASFAQSVPYDAGTGTRGDISAEGQSPAKGEFLFTACIAVEHAFAETFRLRVQEGRDFSESDNEDAPRVVIINRVLANQYWPGVSPIGRRLKIGRQTAEVIGVVGELRFWSITDRARPLVFRSIAQNTASRATIVVSTDGPPERVAAALRRVFQKHDPDLPLFNMRTMEQQMATSPLGMMPMLLGVAIGGSQGVLALLLAALGIGGLVSFAVSRRTREIGIRMALGATRGEVLRNVVGRSMRLTFLGLACGALLAFGLTRVLSSLLYEVSPTDAWVFSGVTLVVAAIAIIASWIPARRATRINPVDALRAE